MFDADVDVDVPEPRTSAVSATRVEDNASATRVEQNVVQQQRRDYHDAISIADSSDNNDGDAADDDDDYGDDFDDVPLSKARRGVRVPQQERQAKPPPQQDAPQSSMTLSSEMSRLSLHNPGDPSRNVTWKWMSGLAVRSCSTSPTRPPPLAIFSVAARSGYSSLRRCDTGGNGDDRESVNANKNVVSKNVVNNDVNTGKSTYANHSVVTTDRFFEDASGTVESVRRISSHCVGVASTSSQQIGQGNPQVSLIFAREGGQDEDDDKNDDRNTAKPTRLVSRAVHLDARPHLTGATAICPFLPIQDSTLSFATGGADGAVFSWGYANGDVKTSRLHALLHRNGITSVETLPRVDLIVSGSRCGGSGGTDLIAFDGRATQVVCAWKSSDALAHLSRTPHPRVLDMSLLRADYDQHKLYDLREDAKATTRRNVTKSILSFGWQSYMAPHALGRPAFHKSYAIQGCPDGRLRMWDLRKPSEVLQEVRVGSGEEPLGDVFLADGGAGERAVVVQTRSAAWRVPIL